MRIGVEVRTAIVKWWRGMPVQFGYSRWGAGRGRCWTQQCLLSTQLTCLLETWVWTLCDFPQLYILLWFLPGFVLQSSLATLPPLLSFLSSLILQSLIECSLYILEAQRQKNQNRQPRSIDSGRRMQLTKQKGNCPVCGMVSSTQAKTSSRVRRQGVPRRSGRVSIKDHGEAREDTRAKMVIWKQVCCRKDLNDWQKCRGETASVRGTLKTNAESRKSHTKSPGKANGVCRPLPVTAASATEPRT